MFGFTAIWIMFKTDLCYFDCSALLLPLRYPPSTTNEASDEISNQSRIPAGKKATLISYPPPTLITHSIKKNAQMSKGQAGSENHTCQYVQYQQDPRSKGARKPGHERLLHHLQIIRDACFQCNEYAETPPSVESLYDKGKKSAAIIFVSGILNTFRKVRSLEGNG